MLTSILHTHSLGFSTQNEATRQARHSVVPSRSHSWMSLFAIPSIPSKKVRTSGAYCNKPRSNGPLNAYPMHVRAFRFFYSSPVPCMQVLSAFLFFSSPMHKGALPPLFYSSPVPCTKVHCLRFFILLQSHAQRCIASVFFFSSPMHAGALPAFLIFSRPMHAGALPPFFYSSPVPCTQVHSLRFLIFSRPMHAGALPAFFNLLQTHARRCIASVFFLLQSHARRCIACVF